jgi:hypothetical protein
MRLFEIRPGEAPGKKFSVWHLDLDQVVSLSDYINDDGITQWFIQQSNNQNFFVTKECFDRVMRAWESNH